MWNGIRAYTWGRRWKGIDWQGGHTFYSITDIIAEFLLELDDSDDFAEVQGDQMEEQENWRERIISKSSRG